MIGNLPDLPGWFSEGESAFWFPILTQIAHWWNPF